MTTGTMDLRAQVRDAYSCAAGDPASQHPFPMGRAFAESVGYPAELLDTLPACAVDAFAGVSNVPLFADLACGASVLDLGCGAGLDAIIAARRVGTGGKVVGVDFSEAMLERAARAGGAAPGNLEFRRGDAEALPLPDNSIDFALVNGIFNLNPDRASVFRELARVMRTGGSAFCAELILIEPLPAADRTCPTNWFA